MRKLFRRLWHSPTFTTWCSRVVAFGRLFLVLPLILSRFDQVQVAAWLLFGSLSFFCTMVGMQASMTFSRMISVAMGGATNLSPILAGEVREASGSPNWDIMRALYETLKSLNLGVAFVGIFLFASLGYFSLEPLLSDYSDARLVWLAFAVFAAGQFFAQVLNRFAITLRGLNQVALTNRWGIAFSTLSVLSGVVVLSMGGDILMLVFTMQFFVVIGVVRQWFLLVYVVEPRFRNMRGWRLDRQILGWAWPPLWKGVVQSIANRGAAKVGAVFLARNMDPASLSGMLLAIRLLGTVEDFATSPITSHVPRLGRLLGEGSIEKFKTITLQKFRYCSYLQVSGVIAIILCGYYGMTLIGADTQLISVKQFILLATAHVLFAQVRQALIISAIGNNIVAVRSFLFAALVTIISSAIIIPYSAFWGFIAACYLPVLIIVNIKPLTAGCDLMNISKLTFLRRTILYPWAGLALTFVLVFFLPWQEWSILAAESTKNMLFNLGFNP